jgi:hypothetical protein
MIDIEIILIGVAVICFVTMIKSLIDLKSILGSMRVRTGRIIKRCDSMIAICDDAGTARKKLIRSRGRK